MNKPRTVTTFDKSLTPHLPNVLQKVAQFLHTVFAALLFKCSLVTASGWPDTLQ
jgi:hypothetical protein